MSQMRLPFDAARDALVLGNHGLIHEVISRHFARIPEHVMTREEMANEARLAMLQPGCRVDRAKGQVSTYFHKVIKNAIARALHRQRREAAVPLDEIEEPLTDRRESPHELGKALRHLNNTERFVVRGLYYRKQTQEQLAAALGINRARVARLHQTAITKLRRRLTHDAR